jgi:hypothetical protein
MNRFWTLILILCVTSLTLACGSSNRQLQSITIDEVANGQQIQFTATGTFSASPTTVSPLPVSWSFAPAARVHPDDPAFHFPVRGYGPYPSPLIALAPAGANASSSGSVSSTKMISGSMSITCP